MPKQHACWLGVAYMNYRSGYMEFALVCLKAADTAYRQGGLSCDLEYDTPAGDFLRGLQIEVMRRLHYRTRQRRHVAAAAGAVGSLAGAGLAPGVKVTNCGYGPGPGIPGLIVAMSMGYHRSSASRAQGASCDR